MMNYEEFKDAMLKKADEDLGEQYGKASIKPIVKPNYNDFYISFENIKVGLIIPLMKLYHIYCNFNKYDSTEMVYSLFKNTFLEMMEDQLKEIEHFNDYINSMDLDLSCVHLRIFNTDMNKNFLSELPHIVFKDLVAFFYFTKDDKTILITNVMCEKWGLDSDTLYKHAKENQIALNGISISPIKDMIASFEGEDNEEYEEYDTGMYVLTNEHYCYGSGYILFPEVLDNICDAIRENNPCNNFYIFPSSVHDLIVMPANDNDNICAIKAMIKVVNDEHVSSEEFLSNSFYTYDYTSKEVSILE